jgi:predicted Zn-dependent peptidase
LSQIELPTIQNVLNQKTKTAINHQPKNILKKFNYQPIVHELAHQHSEITVFLPCKVNVHNKASRKIFDELFLQFYGQLYHRLRDQKGYIYSMYSQFREDLQVLEINLSCEVEYIAPIITEIKEVFGNWDEYFDEQKFLEFKSVVKLKLDMANDGINAVTKFVESRLINYGVVQTFEEYEQELDSVSKDNIEEIYQDIQSNLPNIQIVAVSKNQEINSLSF